MPIPLSSLTAGGANKPTPPAPVAAANTTVATSALGLIRARIDGVRSAYLAVYPAHQGDFSPTAIWPPGSTVSDALLNAGLLSRSSRSPVVCGSQDRAGHDAIADYQVAVPVCDGDRVLAVVAVDTAFPVRSQQELVLEIQQNAQWLSLLFASGSAQPGPQSPAGRDLMKMLAEADSGASAMHELATELAALFHFERVWLGVQEADHLRVTALSNNVSFDAKQRLVQVARDLMQDCAQHPDEAIAEITRHNPALTALVELTGSRVYTMPLSSSGKRFGMLLMEREPADPLSGPEQRRLAELVANLAPVLLLLRTRDQGAVGKIRDETRSAFAGFATRGYSIRRLAVLSALATLAFLALMPGDFRVSGKARLEGAVQRAVVSPYDGFVQNALARAGQTVQAGDLLAELDATDLQTELREVQGEVAELQKQYRKAAAVQERAQARIYQAQTEQAQARLDLLQQQIQRGRLFAPMSGLVIAGDLSRSLGSPVSRGDVLFEISPLDGYRVAMEISGRDIQWVQPGQPGELVLEALPDRPTAVKVTRVSRIIENQDRVGAFRVEAELVNTPGGLRPGMQGIGKVQVARRSLLWIWTRPLRDWLHYQFWRWMP